VAELPSGTVTFLFTDLEGSTRLWEQHPDAMRLALARHDAIVREAIAAHGGRVVKATGDGFHAAFATADAAVGAALDAQAALTTEPWGESGALSVRMGLHTGTAEQRDGDYFGSVLNRAARLMSVAHGGQVVVSHVTEQLIREAIPANIEILDLGEHRLRDLAGPMRVFQLNHPDLPREFLPLRSLDALPGNLPAQVTSFVGRERELAGLGKVLDEWRLVTLTGTGGVGKTRLALQVAAETLPRFRDGAWLCELAVADDDETMAQVVAAVLGVSQRQGMSLEASVGDYLRVKELLLILDNCEHLLGPVGGLAERVMRECPRVRILATSREGLAVGGEHVWPLRSLPVPDASGALTVATASDAVSLFVDRAEAARATFVLDESNVSAVADICRRLDGIPLAIELAAARVVSMSPSEIRGLLDERFRLLTGRRRRAVERHQTLRATVDWSYSLLGERERAVFNRLGIFAATFDAAAAQAIVAGDGVEAWDVLDALTELVAKSMIDAAETGDGTTRYQMLETLGQYARERLDEDDTTDHWRRRHGDYFAMWAEEAGPGLLSPDELAWRTRANAELDNLRAAVTWALDRDDPDDLGLALRIIGALAHETTANPAAGVAAWALRALPHIETTTPQLRYAVTAAAARHPLNLGNYDHARQLALTAIGDGVPPGAPAPADAHGTLAVSALMLGEPETARAIALESARRLDRDSPGSPAALFAHCMLSVIASPSRDPIARTEAELVLRLARETANPTLLASALHVYGFAMEVIADDPTAALAAFDESIALGRQGASPTMLAATLVEAAGMRARTGNLPDAARGLREGVERSHQTGFRTTFYSGVWFGVAILIGLDHLEQAAIFDGIASTLLTPTYRASAGAADWTSLQAAIASARTAYGPEQYDAAFQTGAQMTYDQAVEHTLRVLDDMINETNQTHPT
jgi:predicted ATPase/class 3 adenylate cyclase